MSKWSISEKSIYDENGQQIIESSEWYMRGKLQEICDEHNKSLSIPTDDIGEFIKTQFIKIEDARIAICDAIGNDCTKCPLNENDKCGEIEKLGIFNTETMRLELKEPETDEVP